MMNLSANSSEGLLSKFLEDTQSGMGKFASAVATPSNHNASLDDILSRLDKAISKTAGAMEEEAALMEEQTQANAVPMQDDAQVAAAQMISDSAEQVTQAANAVSQAASTAAQVATEAEGAAQEVAQTVAAVKEEAAAMPAEGMAPAEPTPEELDQALDTVASALVEAFTKQGSVELTDLLGPAVAQAAAEGAAEGVMTELNDEEGVDPMALEGMNQEELMPLLASCAEQYLMEKHASGEITLDDKTANFLGQGINALKGLGGAAMGAMKAHPGMTGAIGGGLAGLGAGMGIGSAMGGDGELDALAELLAEAGMIPPGQDPVQWVEANPDQAVQMAMQILQQQGAGGAPEASGLDALASAYFGDMDKTASSNRNYNYNKEAAAADSMLQDLTLLAALGAATLEKAAGINTGMDKNQENELLKAAAAAYDKTFSK